MSDLETTAQNIGNLKYRFEEKNGYNYKYIQVYKF